MAETELMKTPTFRSLSQRFAANVGDTVRLPCLVDRLEGFVILWKKGADIITVASQILDKVCTLHCTVQQLLTMIFDIFRQKSSIFHL